MAATVPSAAASAFLASALASAVRSGPRPTSSPTFLHFSAKRRATSGRNIFHFLCNTRIGARVPDRIRVTTHTWTCAAPRYGFTAPRAQTRPRRDTGIRCVTCPDMLHGQHAPSVSAFARTSTYTIHGIRFTWTWTWHRVHSLPPCRPIRSSFSRISHSVGLATSRGHSL